MNELSRGGGRGGSPLYKLYRYVAPHRVGFLRRFGLKAGIRFVHFGLESDIVFERVVQYTRTVTVRIMHLTIRTDRKDLKMAYNP